MRSIRRSVAGIVLIACLAGVIAVSRPAAAQEELIQPGRVSIQAYEALLTGRGDSMDRNVFPYYLRGLLAGFEWTIKDQRAQGVTTDFCPPESMAFTVDDLKAIIKAEVNDHPQSWQRKNEQPVGWAAAAGYRRRFPCPAGTATPSSGRQSAADVVTIKQYVALRERRIDQIIKRDSIWSRLTESPDFALMGFGHGFRDGVDGVQSLGRKTICIPVDAEVWGRINIEMMRELNGREQYWADKLDQSAGRVAIIAVKKRYPCTN